MEASQEKTPVEAFREVNLSDGKCNVSLYVCAEEEKKIDADPEYASELFKAAIEGRLPSACDDSDDAEGGSDNVAEDTGEKEEQKCTADVTWDSELTWLLLDLIKKGAHLLSASGGGKKALFRKVKVDLQAIGYDVSYESVRQKFAALMTTYKKIQLQAKQEGQINTQWEYLEIINEIMKRSTQAENRNGTLDEVMDTEFIDIKSESNCANLPVDSAVTNNNLCLSPKVTNDLNSVPYEEALESPIKKVKSKTCPARKKRKVMMTNDDGTSVIQGVDEESMGNDSKSPYRIKKGKVNSSSNLLGPGTNGLMKGTDHIVIASEGFTHSATLFFIDCVKRHKDLLKKKRSAEMFSKIKEEMATEGFLYQETKLRKKWYDLLMSYKRILERANETGDMVATWPYYEAIDSIIVDTKALAPNRIEEKACIASTSKMSGQDYVPGYSEEVSDNRNDRNLRNSRLSDNITGTVFDIISSDKNDEENSEFQRNLLELWEQRELRREERDIVKLEVLKKIAKSVETMNRKQDMIIEILKNLK